ncbi:CPSF A subunit region-domain-containing protein [Lentinula edodes]|nr:CPSF A subunit region-domain-containing protein [Lentinula edodes]
MSTRITSTFHPSSSIISSVKCSLISPDLSHLVVAKLNSVSVYSILESGLQLECSVGVRGKVRVVRAVPIQNSHRSNLLILLDHPDPELLIFKYTETSAPRTATLNIKHQIPLDERGSRPSELCTDAIVHPSGVFGVVSCYTGKLKVVMMESGEVFGLQIPELNLLSYTFLPLVHKHNYALALLYIDYKEHIQLVSRNLRISPDSESNVDLDISSYSNLLPPTTISYKHLPNPAETAVHLIPIPADEDYMYDMHMDEDEHETDVFLGGILVVGGSKILLYELTSQETREFKPVKGKGKRKRDSKKQKQIDAPNPTPNTDSGSSKQKNLNEIKKRDPRATVEWPWSWVTACTPVDEDESSHKILIGDAFGRLAMLSLYRFKEFGMALIPLGETSPPTSLTYLSNQITFVGSHLGDSQLVRISQVALSTAKESLTLPIPESVGTRISVEEFNGLEEFNKLDDERGKGPSSGGKGIKKGWIVATHGSFVEVIQTFKNIAPIRDAVLADLDGSGQSHIVTCSGGGNAGSVNIVRIGADFEETAAVQGVEGVIDMWPVRLSYGTALHSYFITTTLLSTHVFKITSTPNPNPNLNPNPNPTSTSNPNPTQLECVDTSHDFILPNQTLFIGNMALKTAGTYSPSSALVVQVVPEAAVLLQYDAVLGRWTCVDRVEADADKGGSGSRGGSRGKFVKASGNASQLLIAQAGGWVAVYTVQMREGKLSPSLFPSPSPSWYNTEISALTCPLLDPSKHFTRLIAAAFWHTNQLALYTFTPQSAELELLCQSPLGALTSPVRAVVMGFMSVGRYRVEDRESHLCVFAGLADGGVVSTRIKVPRLKDMNIISLGNTPVSFTQYEADGRRVVVAAGSRAVVFSWEGSHLRSAPVMLKDITAVTTLNTENYPNSLMLATDFGISIGRVRSLEKMHIRSTSLGLHTPRHIVHEPTHRVFGVGTVYTEPCRVGEEEKTTNSVKLIDDTTLEVLAQAELQQDEQIMSLAVLQVNDHHHHHNNHNNNNNNNTSQQQHLLCVGTFSLRLDETEPTSGKILLFEIQHASSTLIQLKRVAATDVGGCVYSLVVIDGLLAAAINSSVSLYRVSSITEELSPSTPSYTIHSMMEWNHNYMVTSLSAYRNHLVVADQFSSVSLLRLEEEDGGDDDDDGGNRKLVTVARDYSPLWPVCVEAVDDKSFVGADQSLNMFTFSLSGSTNNRTILVRDGFYHVGDLITKFIRGSLATTTDSAPGRFKSTHIFCTLSGQIGVITSVENDIVLSRFLSALELQLGQKSISAGGVSHAKHRAPRLSRGRSDADSAAYGILDGDLLEQMLTYMNTDPELAEEIYTLSVAGDDDLPYTLAELKKDLELLQNMH